MSKYLDRNLSKKDRYNYEFNFNNDIFVNKTHVIVNLDSNGSSFVDENEEYLELNYDLLDED